MNPIAVNRTPAQREFALRDPRYRPMSDLNGAMALLDLSADEINELLDCGDLTGWNIAVAADGRREVRLLTASIAHYLNTQGSRPWMLSDLDVFRLVLPHEKPSLTGVELQRSFNCDSGHVINLIEAGCLAKVPGTDYGQGRGNTPLVTRPSVFTFLKNRQI